MHVNAHFLKRYQKSVDEGGQHCFRFAGWELGNQQLPSPAAMLRTTLKRKALQMPIASSQSFGVVSIYSRASVLTSVP